MLGRGFAGVWCALHYGCDVLTLDRDFARFTSVRRACASGIDAPGPELLGE
ncbi:MAG: hypothetical protein LC644_11575 [Pseudonocardia sp.]|nr:hypothetical protein [Pseudonocardia sp.]